MSIQPMNCLPPVSIPSGTYYLPLSPSAAGLLTECALRPADVTLADIGAVIRNDPPFTIWLLLANYANLKLDTIRQLAIECLSPTLLNRLVWDERCDGWDWAVEWDAESCARQSAIAMQRLDSVDANDFWDSRNSLLVLIADAHLWLRKSGNEGDLARFELPGRLQFLLSPESDMPEDRRPTSSTLATAKGHWTTEHWTMVQMLPRVAEQSRELRDLKQSFEARVEREKLRGLKELAYGASHEINNPLANIATRAQTLLMDELDPKRQRALAAINRQSFRAHEMIADLMLFAKPPRLEIRSVCAIELFETIVDEFSQDVEQQRCCFTVSVSDECPQIAADPVQVGVVLRALVRNSLEAMNGSDSEGWIHLLAEVDSDPQTVILSVIDNGPGIPQSVRPHLFDPFYSGREAGRGLGFGMAKAWRIVDEHGGSLDVDSAADSGGTQVIVRLPRRKSA
jgi:signal transduction histidine kinase